MFIGRGFLKHLTGLATLALFATLPIPKTESQTEITREQAMAVLGLTKEDFTESIPDEAPYPA